MRVSMDLKVLASTYICMYLSNFIHFNNQFLMYILGSREPIHYTYFKIDLMQRLAMKPIRVIQNRTKTSNVLYRFHACTHTIFMCRIKTKPGYQSYLDLFQVVIPFNYFRKQPCCDNPFVMQKPVRYTRLMTT